MFYAEPLFDEMTKKVLSKKMTKRVEAVFHKMTKRVPFILYESCSGLQSSMVNLGVFCWIVIRCSTVFTKGD